MSAMLQAMRHLGARKVTSDVKLAIACKDGDIKTACKLLAKGVPVNSTAANNWTPLHYACDIPLKRLVDILLYHGAPVNARASTSTTPLHLAVDNGAVEITATLLGAGARVDVAERNGRTSLHIASLRGNLRMVELLLRHKADVHARRKGTLASALHDAAFVGHGEIVRTLIAAGAAVDCTNALGATPLHVAAMRGHVNVCTALIKLGADAAKANIDGLSPPELARRHNKADVAAHIESVFNHHRRGWVVTMISLLSSGRASLEGYAARVGVQAEIQSWGPLEAEEPHAARESEDEADEGAALLGAAAGAGTGTGSDTGLGLGSEGVGSVCVPEVREVVPPPPLPRPRAATMRDDGKPMSGAERRRSWLVASEGAVERKVEEVTPPKQLRHRAHSEAVPRREVEQQRKRAMGGAGKKQTKKGKKKQLGVRFASGTQFDSRAEKEAKEVAETLARLADLIPDLQRRIIKFL